MGSPRQSGLRNLGRSLAKQSVFVDLPSGAPKMSAKYRIPLRSIAGSSSERLKRGG